MASMSRKGSPRYLAFKFWNAVQECLQPQTVAKQTGLGSGAASEGASTQPQTLSSFIEAFKKAFHAPVTSVMYITGPAMAPVLNKAALTDRDAYEKLVVRKIRWPLTPVFTGDVVALKSPLASLSDTGSSIMIRRIAAMEGDELELAGSLSSADQEDEVVEVPKGHCWVLADNHELNHHQVADSRAFGPLPLENVVGRVLYHGTCPEDAKPVVNSPLAFDADDDIIEAEIDPEKVFSDQSDTHEQ